MWTRHVGVVTWNVAEMPLEASDVEGIAASMELSRMELLFVTAQELFALTMLSIAGGGDPEVVPDPGTERNACVWDEAWERTLGESWYRVCAATLGAVRSSLYARRRIREEIREVECDVVACGLANMLVNKGAAAIRVVIGRTSMVFVGAHLNAHAKRVARRNADFRRIDASLFRRGRRNSGAPATAEASFDDDEEDDSVVSWFSSDVAESSRRLLDNFDRIVFAGDLNYRLTMSDRDEFDRIYDPERPYALIGLDELRLQIDQNKAFEAYLEAPVKFPPTYKYDKGTDTFDSSKKRRVPSWTDRVLFAADGIAPYDYNSLPDLRRSDHKPVFAKFAVLVE